MAIKLSTNLKRPPFPFFNVWVSNLQSFTVISLSYAETNLEFEVVEVTLSKVDDFTLFNIKILNSSLRFFV